MTLAEEIYKPKSILVTGGAGFIASHVATKLVKRFPDCKIVVFDKLDYCATLNNLGAVWEYQNFRFIKGDIQSPDLVMHVLHSEKIDTVMHFAAQTHVDNSFGNSLAFTLNNTHGTHVLLEACRVYGQIRRFINVSTDEVYGESSLGKENGLTEDSPLEPTNPYSAAKAGAEMISHLPVHGDGLAVRSYLYVDDVAEAFLVILAKGKVGDIYNIGTKKERTVVDVAKDICGMLGADASEQVLHVRDRAFNDRRYFIDDTKLAALGWKEEVSWEDGLRKTVEWYKSTSINYWDHGSAELALDAHPTSQPAIKRKETRGAGGEPLQALRRKPTSPCPPPSLVALAL
ncbi:hypothetical protein Ndes2437B_g02727 [Nannochloris sp. 'desiccata']